MKNLPSFQQYQLAFTGHIPDPLNKPRPKNFNAGGMNVYKEIVFNNLFESVSACFPVAQKVIGKRAWHRLVRGFFSDYSSTTPIFRKIPEEFLAYLTKANALSTNSFTIYLTSLCHYEWIELYVSTMKLEADKRVSNVIGDLRKHQVTFTPTMQLLNYEYAVQKISPRYKPNEKENTKILVFRNTDFEVKFIALNPMAYRLIEL